MVEIAFYTSLFVQDQVYYLYPNFDPSTRIFQYMDFDYFLNLVENNQYFISYKKEFKDKRESFVFSKYMTPIYPVGANIGEEQKRQEGEKFRQKMEAHNESTFWPTSCWTLQSTESYLMWKAYTSKIGVRVETTIDDFVLALNAQMYDVICGKMSYEGYHFQQKIEESLYSKEKYYTDEREFRFYFQLKNTLSESEKKELEMKHGEYVSMDSKILIKEVTLSPFIHRNTAVILKKWLEKDLKLTGKVVLSKIELK